MTDDRKSKNRSSLARAARGLGAIFLGAAIVVAVLLAALLFSKTRGMLLSKVLTHADAVLPGKLSIEKSSWPSLETLEFAGIHWVDGADSLVAADRVRVSFRLMSLFKKDIRIETALLEGVSVDAPAIRARFVKPERAPAKTGEKKGGFPRDGSIPGVPSIYAERIRIDAPKIRLGETSKLNGVVASLGFDLTYGASPWVRIDTLAAAGPAGSWRIDRLSLYVAPDRGIIEGEGSGALSAYWPARLSMTPRGRDRFELALAVEPADTALPAGAVDTKAISRERGDSTQSEVGAWFDITLGREGLRLESIAFDGRLRTPGTAELSRTPLFEKRVAGLPDLEGVGLSLHGTVGLGEEISADIECAIDKNNWIESGEIAASYAGKSLSLRRVVLELPDLSIAGRGASDADSLRASAEIRVKGSRWLETLFPGVAHPEPLSAVIGVNAAQARGGHIVRGRLTAEGTAGTFKLDGLDADATLSLDGTTASRVVVMGEAKGFYLGIGADFVREPNIVVSLAPIVLQTTAIDRSEIVFSEPAKGTVRFSPASKTLFADAVRVTGDLGDLTVDADLDGERRGPFSVAYRALTPPPVLLEALGLSEDKTGRLRAEWAIDAPFSLEIEGELISTRGPRVRGSGTFSLPGPRNLAVMFPDSARVDDLGPLSGTLSFSTVPDTSGMAFSGGLDFHKTAWIDSSVVRVRGSGGEVSIDTAGVMVGGIKAGVSGRVDHGVFDVAATVRVSDAGFARRFVRSVPDVVLDGRAVFRGTPQRPVLKANVNGSVKGEGYFASGLIAEVDLDTTRIAAVLRAPSGITTPQVRLDRVVARAWSVRDGRGVFPVRLSLDAAGEQLALRQTCLADTTGGVSVEVDTLQLGVGNENLQTRRPFRIHPLGGRGGLSIEDVDLAGTLGTVRLSGILRPDSSEVSGTVSIALPKAPPPALKRPHLWPRSVGLEFKGSGTHDISAALRVTGFKLVDERRPEFKVEMEGHKDLLKALVTVADSLGEVVVCRGAIPATVTIYPPSVVFGDGPISLDAVVQRLPAVTRMIGAAQIPRDEIVRLDGRIAAGGTLASPVGAAKLALDFKDWPKMSQYRAEVEAVLGARPGVDSLLSSDRVGIPRVFSEGALSDVPGGLAAALDLQRGSQTILSVRAEYPLEASLRPPRVWTDEEGRVDIRADSEEIPLSDFDPLLPLDIGLGGFLKLAFTGKGPVRDFKLDGTITTREFEATSADRATITAESNLSISGSSARPVIKGDILIPTGLIRVPDMPKQLHPREGRAMLWSDSLLAEPPDTAAILGKKPNGPANRPKRLFTGELDVSIRIPSKFWIRGKGLDIELSGDLNVREKDGRPIVTGELRAIRGNFIALGRTLDLERGTVTFYGGDETNPTLDIALTTNVNGTKIEILFSGTAQKPKIDLRSEPDMSETDIVSVLLFGRSANDLDDDQADLAKKRGTELVASLGAAKLQQEVGGELGVDVVTVKDTGTQSEGSAVSFGKYLNPRTLLSYAYPLDSQSRPFVSLEYFLKGRFVVVSTYDTEGRGSLGVGWSKDY